MENFVLYGFWDGVETPNVADRKRFMVGAYNVNDAYQIIEINFKNVEISFNFARYYAQEDAIIELYTIMNNQSGYFDTGGAVNDWYTLKEFKYVPFNIRHHYIDELLENLK